MDSFGDAETMEELRAVFVPAARAFSHSPVTISSVIVSFSIPDGNGRSQAGQLFIRYPEINPLEPCELD